MLHRWWCYLQIIYKSNGMDFMLKLISQSRSAACASFVLRIVVLTYGLLANAQPLPDTIHLGSLQILSSPSAAPVFEIAVSNPLPSNTQVRLAPPHSHAAKGYAYPLWLSDAAYSIKVRPGQRQSVQVLTTRAQPSASSEIILEFSVNGGKRFASYYLLLDQPSSFSGQPLPAALTPYEYYLQFDNPAPSSVKPAPEPLANPPTIATNSNITMTTPFSSRRVQPKKATLPPAIANIDPPPKQPSEQAALAFTAPPLGPQVTASMPASFSQVAASQPQAQELLSDSLIGIMAIIVALLVLLILYRLWRSRQAQHTQKNPFLPDNTQFSPI
jgi:hypothetical protein